MPLDFQTDVADPAKIVVDPQLCFDFSARPAVAAPRQKAVRQRVNYYAGLCAEDTVAQVYTRNGARLLEKRWRGPGGEIDLIFEDGARVVFVEVKTSKTHVNALQRVTHRQMARICASAEAYLGRCPQGSLTDMRIDVALVDGHGAVRIVRNASMTL